MRGNYVSCSECACNSCAEDYICLFRKTDKCPGLCDNCLGDFPAVRDMTEEEVEEEYQLMEELIDF